MKEVVDGSNRLCAIVTEEIKAVSKKIPVDHFFVLTDRQGVVVHLEASEPLREALETFQVTAGSSFALEYAGINGISLAMQLRSTAVVEGSDHSLQLFRDWACLCHPIVIDDEIVGYLDLSMKQGLELSFAVMLLEQSVQNVVHEMKQWDLALRKEKFDEVFDTYQFTSLEKEVGFAWLHHQSALQIANHLNIDEEAVLSALQKVYEKTGSYDKGQYVRKLLVCSS
ncbi:hypothetical protein [Paenibacillus sp. N3.4]|uniref:helix-turn-helix transcriptional regulator n=1 Tax=Paenibacillus sp. N3.4 TaxID=2603222 RepID=UPI001650428F|nr:hypothetical protein [Paenibacillus sp. N3.4]